MKTSEQSTSTPVSVYDFRNPKLISKEIIRSLNGMHDVIARQLGRIFSGSTRIKSVVTVKEVNQIFFPDFVSRIQSPSAIFRFPLQGLAGDVILEFEPGFCIYIVERQSGASSTDVTARRELSLIEERVTGKMIDGVCSVLNSSWDPILSQPLGTWKYDSKPENIQIPTGQETAVVVQMAVSSGEHTFPMRICYPYNLVKESFQNRILNMDPASGREAQDPAEQEQFNALISSVKAPVRAVLGTAGITFSEILELQVGDAIKLDRNVNQPLAVMVGNRQVMQAYPGTVRSKRGIKVLDLMPAYRDADAVKENLNENNA